MKSSKKQFFLVERKIITYLFFAILFFILVTFFVYDKISESYEIREEIKEYKEKLTIVQNKLNNPVNIEFLKKHKVLKEMIQNYINEMESWIKDAEK